MGHAVSGPTKLALLGYRHSFVSTMSLIKNTHTHTHTS